MHSCFLPAYPFPFLLPEVLRAIFLGAPGGEDFSVPALSKQSAGRAFSDGIHQWKKYMSFICAMPLLFTEKA